MINPVLKEIQDVIDRQQVKGWKKYGTDIDISTRTVTQWIDEAVEEAVDHIVYLVALKHKLLEQDKPRVITISKRSS